MQYKLWLVKNVNLNLLLLLIDAMRLRIDMYKIFKKLYSWFLLLESNFEPSPQYFF